jgi:hypothetical protein
VCSASVSGIWICERPNPASTIWADDGPVSETRLGKVMMPADLKRLHKYMLEVEHIDHISDEMRAVVESEWPELAHKLPPKDLH